MDRKTIQDQADELNRQIKGSSIADMSAAEIHGSKLSARQIAALRAFHNGAMIHEVAKIANVSRQTLHRWRTRVPEFAEAMNSWETALMAIARSRMADMATSALDALSDAIDQGNAQAAMALLRSLGLLKTYRPVKAPEESEQVESKPTARKAPPVKRPENGARRPVEETHGTESRKSSPSGISRSPVISGHRPQGAGSERRGSEREPSIGNKPALQTTPPRVRASSPTAGNADRGSKCAQPENVTTRSPSKPAFVAKKAGLAISKACDSALHRLTKCYLRLTGFDRHLTGCNLAVT